MKEEGFPLLVIVDDSDGGELYYSCDMEGKVEHRNESIANLLLEIPEYMTFKDGDVLSNGNGFVFILDGHGDCKISLYVAICENGNLTFGGAAHLNDIDLFRLATEEEKQTLIAALKASKDPRAKEYLKRFFGIEEKQGYEFKPFDKVLVRDYNSEEWRIDFFGRMIIDKEDNIPYKYEGVCGATWNYCIPYNEQTAHLLGTTDDWEG